MGQVTTGLANLANNTSGPVKGFSFIKSTIQNARYTRANTYSYRNNPCLPTTGGVP